MNHRISMGLLALLSFALLIASSAIAQTRASSPEFSVAERLASLEAEVQTLQKAQACDMSCDCLPLPAVCDDHKCGEFYAGFSCVLAKPHFKEAFQATIVTSPSTMAMVPFSYDYDLAPRAWFGYSAANGLGLRTRYWQYNQSAEPFQSPPGTVATAQVVSVIFPAVITAVPPAVLNATDKLEVHTLDLEGTQELQIGNISMLASGGLRYAMMLQQSEAAVTNGGVVQQSLSWQRRFEGVGPTISVEVERPLGGCGLAFVGIFRGSLLFGNKDMDRTEVQRKRRRAADYNSR